MRPDPTRRDAELCIAQACQGALDSEALRWAVARHLRRVVPFDAACWSTTDPATMLVTSAVSEGVSAADTPRFLELEYLDGAPDRFGLLARGAEAFALADHEGEESPETRRRYDDVLAPNGQRRELRVAFRSVGTCWGTVSLFRADGRPAFTVAEARWVASLGPTIATGLRLALLLHAGHGTAEPPEPGLVIVADDNTLSAITPAARALLAEVGARQSDVERGLLPAAVFSVAAQARALDEALDVASSQLGKAGVATSDLGPAKARLRTAAGGWVVLYGTRPAGLLAGAGQTTVIVERGRPSEVTPLIVQAYGFSPREREVVRLVLGGYASGEIAQKLEISSFTVQDHLKKVFEKVGVRSRRSLVARILGEHYFPPLGSGARPDASGWFAPEP